MNSEFTIAVHSLVLLAHLPEHMATSEEIAANVSTHSARIRKVMGCLRKAGYVETKEGIGGGFILKCDPSQVTLAEIYRITSQGTLKPSWCSGDASKSCMISSQMDKLMSHVFADAEKQMEAYFEQHTIGSLLSRLHSFGCSNSKPIQHLS
ncbi:RrF2 family transcriptional regulator [Paenibacillus hexagrammi]|uniref:Rrf2 family transcriptional regulator n=1 Tax=Paenibacillus hexagrammi TaxID=2908839 RepID=A0ABY3SFI6_9BACL|nr:Rrf2 family transcriptional regulator [Paenibacillus sp. YPD9-1]UJF32004.1 Rrf2 family transcriptional regulator [Paenibacillus sp. YPD9-1]